jgi:hypothetical protein
VNKIARVSRKMLERYSKQCKIDENVDSLGFISPIKVQGSPFGMLTEIK